MAQKARSASDTLLWLGGAVVAVVALSWLVLAQPWSTPGSGAAVVVNAGPRSGPAGPGALPAAASVESGGSVGDTLRMAQLAYSAGMLLEPENYGAWSLFERALDEAPGHPAAVEGLALVADALSERARTALSQGREGDAHALIARIQERLPAHAGALALQASMSARAEPEPRAAAPRARIAAPTVEPREIPEPARKPVVELRAAFDRALADGRLLAPADNSAKYYLEQLLADHPEDVSTQAAKSALFADYLAHAAVATEGLDTQAATTWLSEADALNVDAAAVSAARAALTDRLIGAESNRLVAVSDLTLLHYEPPVYPARAVDRGTEGWVDLEFTVDRDGLTRDVVIADASHENLFRDQATAAVAKWRFEPRVFMGRSIEQRSFARIRFTLE